MKRPALVTTVILAALLTSCTSDHAAPLVPDEALRNRSGGGAKVDTDPRARMVWAERVDVDGSITAAGISGDGRDKQGSADGTTAHEYQGGYCGVAAKIYTGSSTLGELNADYDTDYALSMESLCGPRRTLNFRMEGGADALVSAPHFIIRELWNMALGEARSQFMGFGIQLSDCQRLMFDGQYPDATDVRVTRTDSGIGVRQWRVETQGTHRAMCVVSAKNGTLKPTGVTHFLPFSVVVTEVPYPYPTYP